MAKKKRCEYAEILGVLGGSTSIKEMSCAGIVMTDELAAALREELLKNTIETLDLSSCEVTERHAELLAQGLKKNSSCKRLILKENRINYGAVALAEALENNSS